MATELLALTVVDAAPAVATSPCLHCSPPLTPAGVFAHRQRLLAVLAVGLFALAAAAWVSNGALLLLWDEPMQRFVEDARTSWATVVVRRISFLGSTAVVLALGAVLAAAAWRRCRAVAVAVIIATLCRPLLEFTVKALVDRDRPDLERLVPGNGPSFPSGHVMASVALWGLVPLVVALYTRRPPGVVGDGVGVGGADRADRCQPHVPRRALVLRRGRRVHRRLLLPARRRACARVAARS